MWGLLNSLTSVFGFNKTEGGLSVKEEEELLESLDLEEGEKTFILKEYKNCDSEEKEGFITNVNGDLYVIDNTYYFQSKDSSDSTFNLDDLVKFTVFYNDLEIFIRNVQKIDTPKSLLPLNDSTPIITPQGYERLRSSGQIVGRNERVFDVKLHEKENLIQFNLDFIQCDFIPYPGDFVDLDILKKTCQETAVTDNDNTIKIVKVRPSKTSFKKGIITSWNSTYGIISNFAIFTNDTLEIGQRPASGEKVYGSFILSDSNIGYKWRAIQIIQYGFSPTCSTQKRDIEDQLRNKQGISISISPKFKLKLDEELYFKIEVTNKSSSEKKCSLYSLSPREQNQITPMINFCNNISIFADETKELPFRILGKFIGSSFEEFIFDFNQFKIRRRIDFEVLCGFLPDTDNDICFENKNSARITYSTILMKPQGDVIPGRKFKSNAIFIPVKIGQFSVPTNLITASLPENKLNFDELRIQVENVSPCLKTGLTPQTYSEFMHTLLFLQEIESMRKIASLEIEAGSFRKHLGYLILDVPELSPYTKLFLPGDYVVASLPWNRKVNMQGIIHRITKSELWLKFSKQFHDAYTEGASYFISFTASRTQFRRMHQAIDLVSKKLGSNWLFPNNIYLNPPQVKLQDLEECLNSNNVSLEKPIFNQQTELFNNDLAGRGRGNRLKKVNDKYWNRSRGAHNDKNHEIHIEPKLIKNIKWYNTMLNIQQKQAIIRILEGVARPLPYFIFGPPGTGKTVTIVEAILQLHHILPQSRILVATPTNSAADLIAERLLDSGNLQDGDFLRLVGLNYLEQGRLTASLIPYSATPCFRDDTYEQEVQEDVQSFNNKQISEHRIIVSTLGCLGSLYSMGFPQSFFTHLFIDEAGQATEPEVMVPMAFLSKSAQVCLSGDPLQLGPVVKSKLASSYGLEVSFLLRLLSRFPYLRDSTGFPNNYGYDPRLVTKLVNNYRSLDGILQLYSTLFYDGDLVTNITNHDSTESKLLKQLNFMKFNSPILFHGLRGSCQQDENSLSWYNAQEIFQVFLYLNKMYAAGLEPGHIGIITPYTLQARKIQFMLEINNMESPKVGSVEEFQGQEKMVIILSLVRSLEDCDDFINTNFIKEPKRVNVAISRARALLIIIGDPELLSADNVWRKIIKYCVSNESYTGCQLPSDIDWEQG